jgi:2'-5' RNA ligase
MKKQTPLYSVVIFPSPEIIEEIKALKQLLKQNIGWFNSCNSLAHITIAELKTEMDYLMYIDQIKDFCKTLTPQNIQFNSFSEFENSGTFYIAPNDNSKIYLDNIIIDIHYLLNYKIYKENINSHITIARKIFDSKMNLTKELFNKTTINLNFKFDALYVRKFNFEKKQYSEIIEKIPFQKS